jgi:alkylation response protein AidB-like acyl-CoA dehydrogenase
MTLRLSPGDTAFRDEVRTFVGEALPADLRRRVALGLHLGRSDYVSWYRILYDKGWISPAWPVEHGGTGWTPLQRHIFDEEMLVGGAPRVIAAGIHMLGPVMIAFGSDAQKRAHLPPIRRSDVFWAQGFSEPGAGSDLAALQMSAVRDGDEFVLNGHKVWTSYAQFCSWAFCLVRTDPAAKVQNGISFILVDLATPGVTVRPLRTIDNGADLNEMLFDNVRVPASNIVGEINNGWSYAKYLLGFERTGIAGLGASKQQMARLRRFAQERVDGERPLLEEPGFRVRMAQLEVELQALEVSALRMLSPGRSANDLAMSASMLKVRGTELRQSIFALILDAAGPIAAADVTDGNHGANDLDIGCAAANNYFDARKLSIYGGTNEVQRNVIARGLLGL